MRNIFATVLMLAGLFGCGPNYSPDTYASNAAQQANKVEQGVVVGVRTVAVSAAGTVGTVTGAAAGGIAGSQAAAGPVSAFTALGGSLVGGIAGSTVEHATADTAAFEYIVRKPNGDLVSVTQKDKTRWCSVRRCWSSPGYRRGWCRTIPFRPPPDPSRRPGPRNRSRLMPSQRSRKRQRQLPPRRRRARRPQRARRTGRPTAASSERRARWRQAAWADAPGSKLAP